MENEHIHKQITVSRNAKEAFTCITRVKDWWGSNFEGSASQLNDSFTVHFGETYGTFKIIEFVPYKKITWLTTDGFLHFAQEKREWVGTKIVFEISGDDNSARIDMTHIGLYPGKECYEECNAGWGFFVGESLYKLIAESVGDPQSERTLRIG